jgi:hypothetical protein
MDVDFDFLRYAICLFRRKDDSPTIIAFFEGLTNLRYVILGSPERRDYAYVLSPVAVTSDSMAHSLSYEKEG